jgi:hypothetical protein
MKLFIMQFSLIECLLFSSSCERQNSVHIHKTGRIIVLYVLMFMFLDDRLEDEGF